MLHHRHIFPKNMEFPEIECYFCMFSLETFEMKRNLIYVIFTAVLYSLTISSTSAQSVRPQAKGSNLLLSAKMASGLASYLAGMEFVFNGVEVAK